MRSLFFLGAAALTIFAVALLTTVSGCSQSYAGKVLSTSPDSVTVSQPKDPTPDKHKVAPDAKVTLDGRPAKLGDLKPGDSVRVTTQKRGDHEVAVAVNAHREAAGKPAEKQAPEQPANKHPMLPRFPAPMGSAHEEAAPPAGVHQGEPAPAKEAKPQPKGAHEPSANTNEGPAKSLIAGEIASLDGNRIQIRVRAGQAHVAGKMTFTATDQTKISIAGKPATLKDLKAGMTVTIAADEHGEKAVAKRIDVKPTAL